MSNTLGTIKDAGLSSKTDLAAIFQGSFKNLLQESVIGLARKIPRRYYKIAGIVSGVVVASVPFILKFLKKKHWVFYVILGIAEIFVAFLAEKEEQRRVILAQ